MKLYPNWRDILRKAWSVRLMLVAALLSGIEVAVPIFYTAADFPPGVFAAASAMVTAAALVARIVAQKDV